MQNPRDKHAQHSKFVVVYTSAGAIRKPAPKQDPEACRKCGKRHGFFQFACK